MNQSPVFSAPVFSKGQPLCVSCFTGTHPTLIPLTSSPLGPRKGDCGSPLLASIPHQSGCSPLVPAFPQGCPDTVPGMWGNMLATSDCVPLRAPLILGGWWVVGNLCREVETVCLPSAHTWLFQEARENYGLAETFLPYFVERCLFFLQ